jgi:hypothetical protein
MYNQYGVAKRGEIWINFKICLRILMSEECQKPYINECQNIDVYIKLYFYPIFCILSLIIVNLYSIKADHL